jgi:hypothetical protein
VLVDDLLASNTELHKMTLGDGYATYQGVLRRAQKFVLDRSIGEVAGDMSRDDVRNVLPFCRLPYPTCWIEIAQQDRPFFADAFIRGPNHSGGRTYQPVRVGILCEQQGDNPQRFFATLAWTYNRVDQLEQGLDTPVSLCPGGVSIWCDTPDPVLDEPFLLTTQIAPYWLDFMRTVALKAPDFMATLKQNADHDWAGEPWFWLGVLALLNARNGASSEFRPAAPALNRARQKAGKAPLVDYHQLTLRIGSSDRPEPRQGHTRGGAMRAHAVRGHFKVRNTGVYWWRPFIRGDAAQGFSGKHYKVTL